MATLRDIDLDLDNARFHAGAAFRLSQEPKDHHVFILTSGAEAVIYPDYPYLVVRLAHVSSDPNRLAEAHEIALCALDVLAIQGFGTFILPNGHREHLLWWRQDGFTTLRYTDRAVMNFRVSVEALVVRAGGTTEPIISPRQPDWHSSFRYFRLSQTTDDLCESYRHMYLALEAVLSSLIPKQQNEGERSWLLRAFRSIPGGFDLSPYVDPGTSDPVANFVQQQFVAHRNALFHAKVGLSFLPGSPEQRAEVATALRRLSGIVVALCQQHLAAQRSSGGVTLQGFAMMIDAIKDGLSIAVSTDDTPSNRDQVEISPKGLPIADLPTRYFGVTDGVGYEHSFFAEEDVRRLAVTTIRTVASHVPDGLITRGNLDALTLANVDYFQVMLAFALNNQQQPRNEFSL